MIYTVGHSTRSLDELTALLHQHGLARLVDVRTVPRSRNNPQFNYDTLAGELAARQVVYEHWPELGGLRKPRKDSLNLGWRNASFRGYADYMQTPEFERSIGRLMETSHDIKSVIMCAEAVPWRCHRSLIADALTVRGIEVRHILAPGKGQTHALTPFAHVDGTHLTYPFALEG